MGSSTTYLHHVFFITLAYFVLWDDDILGNMLNPNTPLGRKALKDLLTLEPPESNSSIDKSSKLNSHYRSNWLETAQNDMLDIDKLRMAGQLVGKLYNDVRIPTRKKVRREKTYARKVRREMTFTGISITKIRLLTPKLTKMLC